MVEFGVGDGIRWSCVVDDGLHEKVVGDLLFFFVAVVGGIFTLVSGRPLVAF